MEKSQYDLCVAVLRRLQKAEILDHMVLVGSWCLPFYKEYFTGIAYRPLIRTRDIDLLIPSPSLLKTKIDVTELLRDM